MSLVVLGDEITKYMAEGHFPPGSMGPKIEAAIQFLQGNGKRALITSIATIEKSIEGKAGTEIMKYRGKEA